MEAAVTDSAAGITVVILTFNEARHIARAIESVRSIAEAVIVIDSFSTDDTVEIARAAGARVLQNPFVSQSQQFQWALDNVSIATPWTLRLDADEIIEADLAENILRDLPSLSEEVTGINFFRKQIFMGRWIAHGGRYLEMMRLWRTGRGHIEDRWMDEHVIVEGGRTITMRGGFADAPLQDVGSFTEKHNRYATREAIDLLTARHGLNGQSEEKSSSLGSEQARGRRRLKEQIYNRLPIWVGPLSYFLYRYFVQLGVLDGRVGLIYHFLQAFWFRFLVDAKVIEFEMHLAGCDGVEEKRRMLSELTGYRL
jgi:glycosyltransferase involved in cell wall biosynthesis